MDNPFPERGFWPLTVTYLVYIIFWEGMWVGGVAYVVFGLGHSPLWFIATIMASQASYNPGHWRQFFIPPTKSEPTDAADDSKPQERDP